MKRVLVWGLSNNRAGTEAVIYNYSKACRNVSFDYLCYDEPVSYIDLFEETNNRYYVIPVKIKHPFSYKKALKRFINNHSGDYEALWFNINDVSNIDLLVEAKKAGIPRRITHMHNAAMPKMLITQFFSKLNWKRCLACTTERWACSESAGSFLYGNKDFKVIPNMVDRKSSSFSQSLRDDIRKKYCLDNAFVIGAIGRFAAQKNFQFIIERLPDILKNKSNAVLFFIGDGPEKESCMKLAEHLGLGKKVIFAGAKSNAKSFLSAFDVFVMPSIYEGLSLAILEAQYNGLPCVVSDGVGSESVISTNTSILALSNYKMWVDKIVSAKRKNNCLQEEKARKYDLSNIEKVCMNLF